MAEARDQRDQEEEVEQEEEEEQQEEGDQEEEEEDQEEEEDRDSDEGGGEEDEVEERQGVGGRAYAGKRQKIKGSDEGPISHRSKERTVPPVSGFRQQRQRGFNPAADIATDGTNGRVGGAPGGAGRQVQGGDARKPKATIATNNGSLRLEMAICDSERDGELDEMDHGSFTATHPYSSMQGVISLR